RPGARLRRPLLRVSGARATRARGAAAEAARARGDHRRPRPGWPEPLVARKGARVEPGEARARLRGALRQARAESVPARHAVPPVPARQGSAGLHLARGPTTSPRQRPDRPEAARGELTERRPPADWQEVPSERERRRSINRAVRRGEAVSDPRDAPAAVERARQLLE